MTDLTITLYFNYFLDDFSDIHKTTLNSEIHTVTIILFVLALSQNKNLLNYKIWIAQEMALKLYDIEH